MEQDKKNAEKKIVILEAKNKELKEEKTGLLQDLNSSKAANVKKNGQIMELMQAITSYRKLIFSTKNWQKCPNMTQIFIPSNIKIDFRTDLSIPNEDFLGSKGDQWIS